MGGGGGGWSKVGEGVERDEGRGIARWGGVMERGLRHEIVGKERECDG